MSVTSEKIFFPTDVSSFTLEVLTKCIFQQSQTTYSFTELLIQNTLQLAEMLLVGGDIADTRTMVFLSV